MKFPHLLICPYFLLASLLFSCNSNRKENSLNENTESTSLQSPRKDSVTFYFDQAKSVKGAQEKIVFLNKALAAVPNENDTILTNLLDFKIYYHNQIKEYDSSLYFSDKLLKTAKFQKDTSYEAMAYYRKATIHKYLKVEEKVFENHYRALQLYLKINDSAKAGKNLSDMSLSQGRVMDYTGSQESATESLKYLNKYKDSIGISSAYNNIAIAYRQQGFHDDAIKEYQNALRYSTNLADSLSHLNNMALVLGDQKKFKEAIRILQQVVLKYSSVNESSKARFLNNLAYTKWLSDSTIDIAKDLQEAKEIRIKIDDKPGLLSSYNDLSVYFLTKDKNQAKIFAKEHLNVATELNSESAQLRALRRLVRLSSGEELRKYSEEYFFINEDLNESNLKAKNTFAKIKYDEEQKEKEITSLEAETVRQQLETKQLEDQMLIMFLGSLLILSIGGFILYYFKHKHKKEKLQEVYITETRISKKIHDELANDIYNMMGSLEPIASPDVLDNLASIYSRTRDISRANSDIDTGENYIAHLLSILSNAAPANAKLIIKGENSINWKNLSKEKKIVIYRVLQEFMVNMKKHSTASFVAIIFSKTEKFLNIDYSDNGQGSELSTIKSGNGLKNVENRIISVNGKLNFETEKGKGLKTNIQIPI